MGRFGMTHDCIMATPERIKRRPEISALIFDFVLAKR
ncbi:hypothetical protein T11_427 [Trichinella zimbabwensis]|uniref:Uncharacterized protein n=1 Tax=Trichinella zimbabwensis TaxID=268475 RepID=A0A0V1FLC5_9BILA|nr:hypothetical protein T11_427 [Trichinella zimbabwensis]